MKAQNIEIIINIHDTKITKKSMGKAVAQLINDKINTLPIEYRLEVYEEILKKGKDSTIKNAK